MTLLINTINNADKKDIAAKEEIKPKTLKDYSPEQAKTRPGIDITMISSVL